MSASNYGNDKKLQIRIPIEIVPDIKDIQEGIKKLQREQRETHLPSAYRGGQKQASLKGTGKVPRGGNAPYFSRAITTTQAGNPVLPTPWRGGQTQTSLTGTATVPQGKGPSLTIAKASFKKPKPPAPHAVGMGNYNPPRQVNPLVKLLAVALGSPGKADKALNFLRNPMSIVRFLGPVGMAIIAGLVAVHVTKKIIDDLVRKGSIFDRTFKNIISNRVEALRTRELQMAHQIGFGEFAQLITTTSAGTTTPRDSYNTYEAFNRDQREVAVRFAIRTNQGYP